MPVNAATIGSAAVAGVAVVKGLDTSGPAAGISEGGGGGGFLSSFKAFFSSGASGIKLPISNPLHRYASYDYVLGLSPLTSKSLNFPNSTYRTGKRLALIAKSAGMDPNNRISTPYGKFDFFIDNLDIKSVMGFEKGANNNATTITFDVIEPYSMGMFLITMQQAAATAGHKNWAAAPFLLTIDFRGADETGRMSLVSGASKQIPFILKDIDTKVTEAGSVHSVKALAWQFQGHDTAVIKAKSEISISGKTVQEILQTGKNSLQAVWNQRQQQLVDDGTQATANQVLILFPTSIDSGPAPGAGAGGIIESVTGATIPSFTQSAGDIKTSLNVSESSVNKTLVQAEGDCNPIGKASLGHGVTKPATAPMGSDAELYSKERDQWVPSKNTPDPQITTKVYPQSQSLYTIINNVIQTSDYAVTALSADNIDTLGFRLWWRIDLRCYNVDDPANNDTTGVPPKLFVYQVIPYRAHTSNLPAVNVKSPGFAEMKKKAVKIYNYIYTGKNTDIISVNINLHASLRAALPIDAAGKTSESVQDAKKNASSGKSKPDADLKPLGKGEEAPKGAMSPGQAVNSKTESANDRVGGDGTDTEGTRAAKYFHDALTYGSDMIKLNMDIIGDPYYIACEGNYQAGEKDTYLGDDGSINYQRGEVDIVVNFRSPLDINQQSGLYNFGINSPTAPQQQFSGLYRVQKIMNHFKGGQFTQTLELRRRVNQENKITGKKDQLYNSSETAPAAKSGDTKTGSGAE